MTTEPEHIYTTAELMPMPDLYDIQERVSSFGQPIHYQMTPGELDWLDFVRGRYSIADWIDAHLDGDILTLDDTFSAALEDDCGGTGLAVCLSDDTALQRLFFWCYSEPYKEDENENPE